MDVYQIESSNISSTISDCPDRSDEITEVKFEAHSEFDLNFFETPEDTVFSNPNSVESIEASPEPATPNLVSSSNCIISRGLKIKIGTIRIFDSYHKSSGSTLY